MKNDFTVVVRRIMTSVLKFAIAKLVSEVFLEVISRVGEEQPHKYS